MNQNTSSTDLPLQSSQDKAWALLLAAREVVDAPRPVEPIGLYYHASSSTVKQCLAGDSLADLHYDACIGWSYRENPTDSAKALFDLYLPIVGSHQNPRVVVGHLGQSVDAKIATSSGDAFFVTGEENRTHLHRLRALCHAVVVGAETVIVDDPQLTTRAVPGANPIRVVIDPAGRVPDTVGILNDTHAETWLLHGNKVPAGGISGKAKHIHLPDTEGRLSFPGIISYLAEQGLSRVFVEGGGVTVSGMLMENCLDYLQIAAAPVLVGAGRPAIQIPGVARMRDALRPPFELYRMDNDVMWHFDVRGIDVKNGSTENTNKSISPPDVSLQRLL